MDHLQRAHVVAAALVDGRPVIARARVVSSGEPGGELVLEIDRDDHQRWERLRTCCELGVSVLAARAADADLVSDQGWAAVGRGAVVLDGAAAWFRCDHAATTVDGPPRLRARSSSTDTAVAPLLFHASPALIGSARGAGTSAAERRSIVRGTVEHGDQRGRTIGFPTANLPIIDGLVGHGVWAGWLVRADGTALPAAISVGRRSTFYGERGHVLLEAHVIGFDGDLYGEAVAVHLGVHLRDQRTFDGVAALIAQLHDDVEAAAAWCERAELDRLDDLAS